MIINLKIKAIAYFALPIFGNNHIGGIARIPVPPHPVQRPLVSVLVKSKRGHCPNVAQRKVVHEAGICNVGFACVKRIMAAEREGDTVCKKYYKNKFIEFMKNEKTLNSLQQDEEFYSHQCKTYQNLINEYTHKLESVRARTKEKYNRLLQRLAKRDRRCEFKLRDIIRLLHILKQ